MSSSAPSLPPCCRYLDLKWLCYLKPLIIIKKDDIVFYCYHPRSDPSIADDIMSWFEAPFRAAHGLLRTFQDIKSQQGLEGLMWRGRCPDASLLPLSLILRDPAGLLLISGKTPLAGSTFPLCPLSQKYAKTSHRNSHWNPAWYSLTSPSLHEQL